MKMISFVFFVFIIIFFFFDDWCVRCYFACRYDYGNFDLCMHASKQSSIHLGASARVPHVIPFNFIYWRIYCDYWRFQCFFAIIFSWINLQIFNIRTFPQFIANETFLFIFYQIFCFCWKFQLDFVARTNQSAICQMMNKRKTKIKISICSSFDFHFASCFTWSSFSFFAQTFFKNNFNFF